VRNILVSLSPRLGSGPCEALPSDLKVQSPTGNARYPDVVVECGALADDDLFAHTPRVLFEVLSPSNTVRQQLKLIADYQAMPSVEQVVFLEQRRPSALLWTRNADGWRAEDVEGLDAVLRLPSIDVDLPMAEVYERLTLEEAR
jgi:Uma2 family endonuclease